MKCNISNNAHATSEAGNICAAGGKRELQTGDCYAYGESAHHVHDYLDITQDEKDKIYTK